MGRLNNTDIIKKLEKIRLSLFTLADFSRLFEIDNRQTLYKKIQRLEKKGIIKKLIKGKYIFLLRQPNEFLIANFLYQPSYISLESALSFYGLITGFPYRITSVTPKKPKSLTLGDNLYKYSQINQSLFWGYEKKEEFLMADPEKALIDYLYLIFKGWRSAELDEFDLSMIDKKKFKNYFRMIQNPSFLRFLKRLKIC